MHLSFTSSFYVFVYLIKNMLSLLISSMSSVLLKRKENNFSFAISKTNTLKFVCWLLLLWTKAF